MLQTIFLFQTDFPIIYGIVISAAIVFSDLPPMYFLNISCTVSASRAFNAYFPFTMQYPNGIFRFFTIFLPHNLFHKADSAKGKYLKYCYSIVKELESGIYPLIIFGNEQGVLTGVFCKKISGPPFSAPGLPGRPRPPCLAPVHALHSKAHS